MMPKSVQRFSDMIMLKQEALAFLEIAERDRVAQLLDARNAVLPGAARGALEEIDRARRDREARALPARAGLAAKAEQAGREQRDADHLAELGPVLVPADR